MCACVLLAALEDLAGPGDGAPGCCGKAALVVGETLGARIVDIAAFQKIFQIETYLPEKWKKKEPPKRGRKQKKKPMAHKFLAPIFGPGVLMVLIFVLVLADDKAAAVASLTSYLGLGLTSFVAATLFRARGHSTLSLPAYKAGNAAKLELNGSNVIGEQVLFVRFLGELLFRSSRSSQPMC